MRRRDFVTLLITCAGGVAALSAAAWAQPAERSWRIGFLALLPESETWLKAFRRRLQELGYSEGKNLSIDMRSAEGRPEQLAPLAAELIQARPDLLVAGLGTLAAKAAAAATTTIPVVFTGVGDPVGAHLVTSLSQPGANVTGLSAQANDIAAKRLQILQEIALGPQPIAVLLNPDTPYSVSALRTVRAAADQAHRSLAVFEARNAKEVTSGIAAAIRGGAAGLLPLEDPLLFGTRQAIVDQVAAARLPAVYGSRLFTDAGGLMSLGVDTGQMGRRAADYVDKVLRGARPADLPVEQPTKFEFVINMKTAKAFGLVLPPTMLALADDVIE